MVIFPNRGENKKYLKPGLFGGCTQTTCSIFVPDITQCQGCLCFNIFPTNRRQPGHPKLPGIQYSRAQIMPQKSVGFFCLKTAKMPQKPVCLIGGWTNPFEKILYRQIGSSSQLGLKIQNIWNHHLVEQRWTLHPEIWILFGNGNNFKKGR